MKFVVALNIDARFPIGLAGCPVPKTDLALKVVNDG